MINIKIVDLAEAIDKKCVTLRWLGQAGFTVTSNDCSFLIDPYLSNYLGKKYADKCRKASCGEFKHIRMMPVPIEPNQINGVQWIICSHRHGDHMDPETLPIVLGNNKHCHLIAPKAEKKYVLSIGVDLERCVFINEGQTVRLSEDVYLEAVASAHERLQTDSEGFHHYLGYIITLGDIVLYHPGDCVPYDGLETKLADKHIDLALIPVNGRDKNRAEQGIPGNFTFKEAVDFCNNLKIPAFIPHHFGMFDFNTVDVGELQANIKNLGQTPKVVIPDTNKIFVLSK
ncbi:MAG: MBL fold metallo-hydrolase [Phycisphaerae bacterium]|nr:MBL fold metallo-hydrolase [Phycisphaerae bacterium]